MTRRPQTTCRDGLQKRAVVPFTATPLRLGGSGDRVPYGRAMPQSNLSKMAPYVGPSCIAGILPLCLVFGADMLFGPWSDKTDIVYYLQAILGPPIVAVLFVPRFGPRAIWVAAGGVLVALLFILMLVIGFAALLSAGDS